MSWICRSAGRSIAIVAIAASSTTALMAVVPRIGFGNSVDACQSLELLRLPSQVVGSRLGGRGPRIRLVPLGVVLHGGRWQSPCRRVERQVVVLPHRDRPRQRLYQLGFVCFGVILHGSGHLHCQLERQVVVHPGIIPIPVQTPPRLSLRGYLVLVGQVLHGSWWPAGSLR